MFVASELKGELARIQPARACCRRAQLAGLLYLTRGEAISTMEHATARTAVQLATSLGSPAGTPRPGDAARPATGRRHLRVVLDPALTADWSWTDARPHDRRAFLRGVLLSASVSMGASGPHVEFVLSDSARARQLVARLRDEEVRSAVLQRRGRHVVYVKGQEEIATLLRLAGANRALLDFENGRVAREVRNRLNRLLNAEDANLDRTVRAADRQLQAIGQLAASGELERLPDSLREAAAQRRLQPDADLDTLASSLGISRSAANHRLRRLVALAAAAREADDPVAPVSAAGRS